MQYGLDGVDIDYEDMDAMNGNKAEAWLIRRSTARSARIVLALTLSAFQIELRRLLPSPYIISHAPVAPWFTSLNVYQSGAYVNIHKQVGSTIDFYNIQFYNQGVGVYTDCTVSPRRLCAVFSQLTIRRPCCSPRADGGRRRPCSRFTPTPASRSTTLSLESHSRPTWLRMGKSIHTGPAGDADCVQVHGSDLAEPVRRASTSQGMERWCHVLGMGRHGEFVPNGRSVRF